MLKIEVDINTLVNGLKEVKRALGAKFTNPALAGVKMTATSEGVFLTMINSNVEMMIQSKLVAENEDSVLKIEREGAVLIDAKRFIEYISKAKTKLIKIEEVDETEVIVQVGRGKMVFKKINIDMFPKVEIENNEKMFSVNSECFLRGLQSTILFARDTSGQNPILSGVQFKISENAIIMRGTDSFRAGQDIVQTLTTVNEEFEIIVPAELLRKTFTLFSKGETVNITTDSRWIRFEVNNEVVAMRLLDGTYPKLEESFAMLTGGMTKLVFLRDDLMQLIDRTLMFKTDATSTILTMEFEKGAQEVTFKAKNEVGSVVETIETQLITNLDFQISINADFLKDILRSFSKTAEEIEFDMYGEERLFSIKEVGNNSSVRIMVPVRIK